MSPYSRKGTAVRLIYLIFSLGWAVLTGFGRFRKKGVVVLCYHGISAGQKERFAWQMSRIWSRGNGCCVEVTFDDAFANLQDNAIPVIKQYQLPATVFAVAENLGGIPRWQMPASHPEREEKIMTAEQLTALCNNGLIKIGSHTMTHPDLTSVPAEQIKCELRDSRTKLETMLGRPVEDLALPHGAYNQAVLNAAKEAGYKNIFTLDPKVVDPEAGDDIVGRFSMSPEAWKIEFVLTCAGMYAWLGPWRKVVRRIRDLTH